MPDLKKLGSVHIGCQGWNYDDWVTAAASGGRVFYPRGTRAADMLEIYARAFESVEVDSTFYAAPAVSTVEAWGKRTPDGFTFSLKMPQEITHKHALRAGCDEALKEFCDRARRLGAKLGVVLIQLAPQFDATPENERALREFLPLLPRDLRFSIEFRDRGWFDEEVLRLLARYNVALALVEGQWVARERVWRLADAATAIDFAYVRWMGERDLTRFDIIQRPRDENLDAWSDVLVRLAKRASGVYAYFSNFYEGHAPASANRLKRLLSQPTVDPVELESQPSLF